MDRKFDGTIGFVRQDFYHFFFSPKAIIVIATVLTGLSTCFGGLRTYLQHSGVGINPIQLMMLALSNQVPLWIIYAGAIVLISDAPFRYSGDIAWIVRSSRKKWIGAQIAFCGISLILYFFVIFLYFLFLTVGFWDFSPNWSPAYVTGAQLGHSEVGIEFGISFWSVLLSESSIQTAVVTLLLQLFMTMAAAMVLTLSNVRGHSKVGLILCGAFPLVDLLWNSMGVKSKLLYLVFSPFSQSMLPTLQPINPSGFSWTVAILYLLFVLSVLTVLLFHSIKTYDFNSIE